VNVGFKIPLLLKVPVPVEVHVCEVLLDAIVPEIVIAPVTQFNFFGAAVATLAPGVVAVLMVAVVVFVQPLASVTATVYVPGKPVMLAVVCPLLHEYVYGPVPLVAVLVILPVLPAHIGSVGVAVICGGKLRITLSLTEPQAFVTVMYNFIELWLRSLVFGVYTGLRFPLLSNVPAPVDVQVCDVPPLDVVPAIVMAPVTQLNFLLPVATATVGRVQAGVSQGCAVHTLLLMQYVTEASHATALGLVPGA
jgi:hypothetical protein